VHMVNAHMPLHDGDVSAHTDLTDKFARPFSDFAFQNFVAVFRHPDEVILNVVDGVRSFAIVGHGFSPANSRLESYRISVLKLFA